MTAFPIHSLAQSDRLPVKPHPPGRLSRAMLDASNRLGVVALFATLAGWALLYRAQDAQWALAAAMAFSDLGLCAAIVAGRSRAPATRRAARGAMLFCGILALLAMQAILFDRLAVLRLLMKPGSM